MADPMSIFLPVFLLIIAIGAGMFIGFAISEHMTRRRQKRFIMNPDGSWDIEVGSRKSSNIWKMTFGSVLFWKKIELPWKHPNDSGSSGSLQFRCEGEDGFMRKNGENGMENAPELPPRIYLNSESYRQPQVPHEKPEIQQIQGSETGTRHSQNLFLPARSPVMPQNPQPIFIQSKPTPSDHPDKLHVQTPDHSIGAVIIIPPSPTSFAPSTPRLPVASMSSSGSIPIQFDGPVTRRDTIAISIDGDDDDDCSLFYRAFEENPDSWLESIEPSRANGHLMVPLDSVSGFNAKL